MPSNSVRSELVQQAMRQVRLREAHNAPKVTQRLDPPLGRCGCFLGEGGAAWTRAGWAGVCVPPRTLGPGPHTPHPSSLPAAAPAPAGPLTVTDYRRDPGDRGGHIWILLQGLAGGLGAGVLNEFQNPSGAVKWAAEGLRGRGPRLSRKVGSEPAREAFLSRRGQAGAGSTLTAPSPALGCRSPLGRQEDDPCPFDMCALTPILLKPPA
ncbi:unnamed protein product [Rangifer tarandus platyrhynchus]|uniref:Uncharacterized protein n=1 Tax=Rangifer tarandus platyrhynchus TaxID=3082113 RepID=A0AC59Z6E2_RANTA